MKQWLDEDDLVYFVMDVVRELDLRPSSLMDAEFYGVSVLLILFVPGIALVIIGGILHTLKV